MITKSWVLIFFQKKSKPVSSFRNDNYNKKLKKGSRICKICLFFLWESCPKCWVCKEKVFVLVKWRTRPSFPCYWIPSFPLILRNKSNSRSVETQMLRVPNTHPPFIEGSVIPKPRRQKYVKALSKTIKLAFLEIQNST